MGTRTILLGVLAVAAGVAVWIGLESDGEKASGDVTPTPPARGPGTDPEDPPRAALRDPLQPAPIEPAPLATDPAPVEGDAPSPLERRLAAVSDTFLGEDPQVAELLEVIGALASVVVVDAESLQVLREADGAPRVARGTLQAGEIAATFHVEEGLFRIHVSGATGRAPLFRRDLQISFGASAGGATDCRAVVQFQADPAETPRTHLAAGEERLVGWMLHVSPETGCEIRPMSVAGSGDEWLIGSRREGEVRELPWISNTASFDAWLRVLQPHVGD